MVLHMPLWPNKVNSQVADAKEPIEETHHLPQETVVKHDDGARAWRS